MQLKRDTDYCMRIVSLFLDGYLDWTAERDEPPVLSLSDICFSTGIPRSPAHRICQKLTEAKLLTPVNPSQKAPVYAYYGDANLTAKDIIDIMEGTTNPFAVFDQRSALYIQHCNEFAAVAQQVDQMLSEIPLA